MIFLYCKAVVVVGFGVLVWQCAIVFCLHAWLSSIQKSLFFFSFFFITEQNYICSLALMNDRPQWKRQNTEK